MADLKKIVIIVKSMITSSVMEKRKNLFFIVGIVIFFSSFTYLSKLYPNEYKISNPQDPSFEARLFVHQNEFNALDNYYKHYSSNKNVGNIYNTLYSNFLIGAKDQVAFMEDNNISSKGFRMFSSELMRMNKEEKRSYFTNLNLVSSQFSITDKEFEEINKLIEIAKNDASYYLKGSLELYQNYIGLAKKLNYTKLEIFEDATGFIKFSEYESNYKSPLTYTRNKEGLASKEAIRKLNDYLKDSEHKNISIYPNPSSSIVNFQILNEDSRNIQITIFDINGRIVKSLVNESSNPEYYYESLWNRKDQGGSYVPSGMYIYRIKNLTTNKEESSTLVLN